MILVINEVKERQIMVKSKLYSLKESITFFVMSFMLVRWQTRGCHVIVTWIFLFYFYFLLYFVCLFRIYHTTNYLKKSIKAQERKIFTTILRNNHL